jgi:MFS superfamily sulfate permease-like transporter
VLLFAAPLYFATATRFRSQVAQHVESPPAPTRCLVLDLAGMHDMDFTGARAFAAMLDALDRRHVKVALARAGRTLAGNLERSGLIRRIGPEHLFDSVDEAVEALGGAG